MDTIKTPIIPIPVSLKMDHGFFCIAENTLIKTDFSEPEQIRIATYLSEILESFYKLNLKICDSAENNPCKSIHLKILAGSDDLSPEAYHLNIATEGIVISAHHSQGLFRGIQTLRQLLPVLLENSGTSIKLQAMEIADFPRFAWRGFMLDVARHFFRVEDVKRIIDLMVFYKMNRLHLHLSDDQGWRLEIKSWPNLTVHGGSSAVNGDPGGFYSQADYMEIIEYAQTNYIMVIPEIDMPGHTNAILSSYPELNADGIAPPLYTGMDVGFCSLNTENELTYQFVDDVVREIAELTLGGYIHIGGDEAFSTKDDAYLYFVQRVQGIINNHGKQMIGWEDIVAAKPSANSFLQHWHYDKAEKTVNAGNPVILSPAVFLYLDMKYTEETQLGITWAGFIDLKQSYEWDPGKCLEGLTDDRILGVEAPLWTETIRTLADVEYMVFPRLAGVAEAGWSQQENRNWENYRIRLAAHGPRLRGMGVNYYPSKQVDWE